MFYEIAASYHSSFFPFTLYPSISDRNAWNSLDEEWKQEILKLGESYLHFEYPSLLATDFMDFSKTGNRTRYEKKLFSKRHALDALVLAECVENKNRFLDDIVNGIFSLCEESAWQLPAHNTYIRDTPQLLLPDSTEPVLDLFACETGAVLGTVYYLLKEKLDEVSPFITKRILHELHQRIFTPYLNRHFWWMGNGREPMNNWTIWCTQNVLLSAFLTDTEESLRHSVFEKACQSADYFLAEYGDDGCCDEGAQYYRHAGLCLFNAMEVLNVVTDNTFSHLYQDPKIQNIASYILNVHIDDKYYVNFADCSPIAGRAGVREFLFAKRTGNESLAVFAAFDFMAGISDRLLLPDENNLYYRLQNGFTIQEIRSFAHSHGNAVKHSDIYYPSTGIFIARDDSTCDAGNTGSNSQDNSRTNTGVNTLYLAVKAGDNADSHNHNDTGSFTVYKNGSPLFIDAGVESYTRKTFSAQRYEIWTMQSAYHNLPTVNGFMQKDGEQYRAEHVWHQLSDSVCEIRMDISAAYPKEANLLSYQRQCTLLKGREIIIKDSFAFHKSNLENAGADSVILSFMTSQKPALQEGSNGLLFSIGTLGRLQITGGRLLDIETIPVTDARLKTAWEHELYRILIAATGNEVEMHIS